MRSYVEAVENAFGMNVDFGMIIKNYGVDKGEHLRNAAIAHPK
jgi:hypothetical protein